MPLVEPVPDAPAAVATLADERALVVADVHVGIEVGLRYERGVELESAAADRRERLLSLLSTTDAERLVVLGDLTHRIGRPDGEEVTELRALVDAVTERVPMTLVPGNHDGGVRDVLDSDGVTGDADERDRGESNGGGHGVTVTAGDGVRLGDVGFVHGHTWPALELLGCEVICMGHEHPTVRLEDEVGGSRVERAWLRGPLRRAVFAERAADEPTSKPFEWGAPELVVFPAFNERSGGTWVNVDGQEFLAPFLPSGVEWADLYLLDGTRLGDYRRV